MIEALLVLMGVVLAAVSGVMAYRLGRARGEGRASAAESQLLEVRSQLESKSQELVTLGAKTELLNREVSAREAGQKGLIERLEESRRLIEQFKESAREGFSTLAQQILDQKTESLASSSKTQMEGLLGPLKLQIEQFEKKVIEETVHRVSLKTEVERLMNLNTKMSEEARYLTQALKGDNKFQGNWGEMILERILEASGLVKDREYELQKQLEGDDGAIFKPDVVIRLPEDRHLIVDSKVSLVAFERYSRALTDEERKVASQQLVLSIEMHVKGLSEKHYARLKGVRSPDFVFMFLPVEPAFMAALSERPDLAEWAWERKVALANPTTLMSTLKVVEAIWKLEKQNKNAEKIAHEGAALYDQFARFLEEFEKIDTHLDKAKEQYGDALKKLKDGRGNVFRRIQNLKELGSSPSREIPRSYLELE
jgi:DNA recombination protein RmuC